MERRTFLTTAAAAALATSRPAVAGKPPVQFTVLMGPPDRGVVTLDAQTYDVDSVLYWNQSDCTVRGVRGRTRIRCQEVGVLILGSCSNVVFEDIVFECAAATRGSDYRGVVTALDQTLRNITFVRCRFTAPRAAINGVKLIAESGDAEIETLHCYDCEIDGVGRMGLEIQNHPHNNDDLRRRYAGIVWQGGRVANTGLLDDQGMGLSFSGYGEGVTVDTSFENNLYACIEVVGTASSTFSGRSARQTRPCGPIWMTNFRPMPDITIKDFKTLDEANGSLVLRNAPRLKMQDNVFRLSGGVSCLGLTDARIARDVYVTRGPVALSIEGYAKNLPSKRSEWDGVTINAGARLSGAYATIRFLGDGTSGNIIRRPILCQAGDGVLFDQLKGATANQVIGARRSC